MDHKPDTILARNGELRGIVAQLGERFAIMELVTTAVTYGDHREWERLAACYAEYITVDYTETLGGTAKQVARHVLMPYWQSLLVAFDATQHAVSNVDVRLDGDSATTRSHVIATHRIEKDVWVCGGVYYHGLERSPTKGWLINAQRMTVLYETGDHTVFERAVARAKPAPA